MIYKVIFFLFWNDRCVEWAFFKVANITEKRIMWLDIEMNSRSSHIDITINNIYYLHFL